MAIRFEMMSDLPNFSYRSLELLCRKQAAISSTPGVRRELEQMANEYAVKARLQEQRSDQERPPTQ